MLRCGVGARSLAGCTVAECLHGARARGSRECYSSWLFLLRCFVNETSQTRKKKKKHSVEHFFLDVCWRNRHNPLAQTSAVADTIGGTAGCIAIVDRNENVAGRDHADVALIEDIGVTLALILRRVLIHAIGVLHQRRPFFTRPIWPPTRLFVIRNFRDKWHAITTVFLAAGNNCLSPDSVSAQCHAGVALDNRILRETPFNDANETLP